MNRHLAANILGWYAKYMKTYDVAVVGLGAVGSAALYQLSKTGLNVVGIDRYAPPHSNGSSFGESRVTRQAIGEGSAYGPLLRRANEIWQELEKLSGEELFNHCGMLITGYEEQIFFKETVEQAKASGITHRLMSGAETERLFPALKVAHTDHAFYYEPTSGFLIPETCVEVQLNAARDNGATIYTNSKVTVIQSSDAGVTVRMENGEVIVARKIIVSSGPWVKELLPDVLSPLLKTYLYTLQWYETERSHYDDLVPGKLPVMLFGVDKAPRTRAFSGFPAISGASGGIKFALDDSDLQVAADQKDGTNLVQPGLDKLAEYVQRYLRYVGPDVVRSFNCLYTSTADSDFLIGFVPGSERIIVGSACSGHGFKHSAATGEVLAQLATRGNSTIDIATFSFKRFT
jgi:sarcosine oxidase